MHPGLRTACLLLLQGSVFATRDEDASVSALVQTEHRVHQALAVGAGEKAAERLAKNAVVFKYVQDFATVELEAYQLLLQYTSVAAARAVPHVPTFLPLAGHKGRWIAVQDHALFVAGLLEAFGNDDFVRNLTYAAAEMESLARWFNETADGHMDLFLETMPNSTSEKGFAVELDSFLRHWSLQEMEFLHQLTSISTGFAKSIPDSVLKEDARAQLEYALANVSAFAVTTMENTTLPNISAMDGGNFCALMVARMVLDSGLAASTDSLLSMINASKSMLPVLGEAFMKAEEIAQPENATLRTSMPRFALVIGVALDSTDIFVRSLRDHRKLLASKFIPLLEKYMDCRIGEAELQHSEVTADTEIGTEAPIPAEAASLGSLPHSAAVSPCPRLALVTWVLAALLAALVPKKNF